MTSNAVSCAPKPARARRSSSRIRRNRRARKCRCKRCAAREQLEHHAGDDSERAFRADEELAQVVAGVVLDHLAKRVDDRAVGEHGFDSQHQIARHTETQHPIAARVGRDVTADLAGATPAEIEGKEQIGRVGGLLHGFHHDAGFDGDGARRHVEILDRAHTLQRNDDARTERDATARKTGHAALGLHGDAPLVAELQDRRDLLGISRERERENARFRIALDAEVMRMAHDVLRIRRDDDIGPYELRQLGNDVVQFAASLERAVRGQAAAQYSFSSRKVTPVGDIARSESQLGWRVAARPQHPDPMSPRLCHWLSVLAAVLLSADATAASPAPFDLEGPDVQVKVTRGDSTLTIAQVPHLAAGDKLWVKAAFPASQSEHYVMVVAFLRGATNPPAQGLVLSLRGLEERLREQRPDRHRAG